MDFATKRLYAAILVLAATPVAQRPAETATAAKVLADLRARSGTTADIAYGAAVARLVKSLGAEAKAAKELADQREAQGRKEEAQELRERAAELTALGGVAEPWIAFTSPGPGSPAPALELLRPAPEAEEEMTVWLAFKKWTGPGQMIGLLMDGEVPDNELKELAKTVTVTIASAAVAGIVLVKNGVEAAAGAAGGFGKFLIAGAAAFGGYKFFTRKRGKR